MAACWDGEAAEGVGYIVVNGSEYDWVRLGQNQSNQSVKNIIILGVKVRLLSSDRPN